MYTGGDEGVQDEIVNVAGVVEPARIVAVECLCKAREKCVAPKGDDECGKGGSPDQDPQTVAPRLILEVGGRMRRQHRQEKVGASGNPVDQPAKQLCCGQQLTRYSKQKKTTLCTADSQCNGLPNPKVVLPKSRKLSKGTADEEAEDIGLGPLRQSMTANRQASRLSSGVGCVEDRTALPQDSLRHVGLSCHTVGGRGPGGSPIHPARKIG